jgi:FAD/FMN-containing dehydrogenase
MGRGAAAARESIEAELAAAMEAGEITDAALAASEAQREMFWRLRETIPEAQSREGASIKHDISVTTSELPRFIVEGGALVAQLVPGARTRFVRPPRRRQPAFQPEPAARREHQEFLRLAPQVNRAVHDLVARYGGSFSAEHGIGQLKRAELLRYKNPVALELMRSIKQAVDPNGIMNPGKVL